MYTDRFMEKGVGAVRKFESKKDTSTGDTKAMQVASTTTELWKQNREVKVKASLPKRDDLSVVVNRVFARDLYTLKNTKVNLYKQSKDGEKSSNGCDANSQRPRRECCCRLRHGC